MVVDMATPQDGETLVEAYNKWRGWADDKVSIILITDLSVTIHL